MTRKAVRYSMNTSIRYVTLPFRDRRTAASLCHRNRAEITVLLYRVKIA